MNSDEPAEKKVCDSKCDPDARKDCPKYDTAK
jgi:hypothetical protein